MTHCESFTARPAILPRAWHWTNWQPALLHFFSRNFEHISFLWILLCNNIKHSNVFILLPKSNESENGETKSIFLGDSGRARFWELFFSCNNKVIAWMLKVNYTLSRLCSVYFKHFNIFFFLLLFTFSAEACVESEYGACSWERFLFAWQRISDGKSDSSTGQTKWGNCVPIGLGISKAHPKYGTWYPTASSSLADCGNASERSPDFGQMGRGNERGLKPKAACWGNHVMIAWNTLAGPNITHQYAKTRFPTKCHF